MCDLRAKLIPAGCAMVQNRQSSSDTYDDGARGVRGQIVLVEDFRMVVLLVSVAPADS